MIHFMGICKYILAASTRKASHYFVVEVKNEHRGNTRVSYTRLVDIKLKGVTIRLMPGNKMLVSSDNNHCKYKIASDVLNTNWIFLQNEHIHMSTL